VEAIVGRFLQTFKDYPPRAKPGSFSLDQAQQKMQQATND
jgi:arylsulfatase